MAELMLEKQILSKLENMEKRLNYLVTYIEDSRLTVEEKQILQESYQHEKEGKLISGKELAKKLRL